MPPQPKPPRALMIDALTWFGKEEMLKLVHRHLDPEDAFGIEAELNFEEWPPRKLATELEAQIRAHGLLEQAVGGMRELEERVPDVGALAVALGVATSGEGLSASSAIPPKVRDEVIAFSAVFAERRPRFQFLAAYKELHDHLHALQGLEDGIGQAAGRFRERPDQPGELRGVAAALTDLAAKSRRSYEALKKPRRIGRWLEAFERSAAELRAAADRGDPPALTGPVAELRRLPGANLSDLNEELLECIALLDLPGLGGRMASIHAGLSSAGVAQPEFVASLSLTLGQFRTSCDLLPAVMDAHDACQAFETTLALAADSRGAIGPAQIPGWTEARVRLASVVVEPGDARPADTARAAERFEAASAAADLPSSAAELARLLGMFRPLFNEIDKRLLDRTDRMVKSAAYLDVQLRNAANVTT